MRACACVCVCIVYVCICMWVYVRLYILVYPPATRWEVREENRIGAPRRRKLFTSDSDNRKRERISGFIFIFGCFGKLGRNKEIGVPYNSLWFFFFCRIYICTCTFIYTCVCVYIHTYIHTFIYIYVCMYVCMFVYIFMHIYIFIYAFIHIYAYINK